MMLRLYHCCLIHFILFLGNGGILMCEVFLVGDEDGWNSDTNFVSWSQNHNYTKGDFLVFNYPKNVHNVYEVSEGTYRSCNASRGVLAQYDSGNDEIKLKEARKYWFICNVVGHCLDGMRFGIQVKEANSSIHVPLGTAVEPPPLPTTTTTTHASNGSYQSWSSLVSIMAFVILFS